MCVIIAINAKKLIGIEQFMKMTNLAPCIWNKSTTSTTNHHFQKLYMGYHFHFFNYLNREGTPLGFEIKQAIKREDLTVTNTPTNS